MISAHPVPAETLASCGACLAQNYTGGIGTGYPLNPGAGTPIFAVRVTRPSSGQTTVSDWCADCLAALTFAVHPYRAGIK